MGILSAIFLIIFGLVLYGTIRKLSSSKAPETVSNATGAADFFVDVGDPGDSSAVGHHAAHDSHHHDSSHDLGGQSGGHDSFDGGFSGGGHH